MNKHIILLVLFFLSVVRLHSQNTENRFVFFKESFDDNENVWRSWSDSDTENLILNKKYIKKQDGNFFDCSTFPIGYLKISKSDYFISFDFFCLEPSIEGESTDAGFFWDYIDDNNHHRFRIDSWGNFIITHKINGVWQDVDDWKSHSAIKYGRRNQLEIKIEQSNLNDIVFLSFYVNNEFIQKVPYQNFDLKKCGLYVAGPKAAYEFDNVCLGYLKSLKEIIQMNVENDINIWQQKGEFEKTADCNTP